MRVVGDSDFERLNVVLFRDSHDYAVRLSDRIGRRPMLLWSVVGYTVFTAHTALSWDIWSFAFFQFASRIFLGAEGRHPRTNPFTVIS